MSAKTARNLITIVDMPRLVWQEIASIGMFFLVIMAARWVIYSTSEMVNDGKYTHQEAVSPCESHGTRDDRSRVQRAS